MCNQCASPQAHGGNNEFVDGLLQTINSAGTALMMSVGHRTKLFDTMASMRPSTSETIAEAAGLNERYVREWLGSMVTAGIIEYDRELRTYNLPETHAEFLTRKAGSNNVATVAQFVSVLGSVEDRIVECFHKGGGVPYSAFGRFHEVMAEESGQTVLLALEDTIIPLIPGIREKLEAGIHVLDVGCGRGRAMTHLAGRYPNSRFVGYDISKEAIDYATQAAEQAGVSNAKFFVKDVALIDDNAEFDLAFTFDAIHDQADPGAVLRNIRRALKPGGIYLMQEIGLHTDVADNAEHPLGSFVYTISCMHCMTVSLSAKGAGLGAAWGVEKAAEMLHEAGFGAPRLERLPHDIMNAYFVVPRG